MTIKVTGGVNETVRPYEALCGARTENFHGHNYCLLALLPASTFNTLVEQRHLGDWVKEVLAVGEEEPQFSKHKD